MPIPLSPVSPANRPTSRRFAIQCAVTLAGVGLIFGIIHWNSRSDKSRHGWNRMTAEQQAYVAATFADERAATALKAGDTKTALREISDAIVTEPKNPKWWLRRGHIRLATGDASGAIADADEARARARLGSKEEAVEALRLRGRALLLAGRAAEAAIELRAFLAEAPAGHAERSAAEKELAEAVERAKAGPVEEK